QGPEEVLELLEELKACEQPSRVEWPRGRAVRLAGMLKPASVKLSVSRGPGRDWFSLSGEARIDEGRVVTVEALLQSLEGSRFVSLGDGEYLALTDELRRKLASMKAMMAGQTKGGELQFSGLAAPAVEQMAQGMDIQADAAFDASLERMHKAFSETPAKPDGLMADLRDYQREGYEWLQRLTIWGVGACLADDMGLGKTVQTIAAMLNQSPKGPCLVVAPTTVCANWEREIARFAPRLETKRLGLAARDEAVKAMGRGEVLVVGYGLLPNVAEELASRSWAMAVYDEAQALKNPLTKRAAAARNVKADFRVALTGTPIENRLDDLWSIFSIINPGLLGSYERFKKRFGQAAPGSPQGKALRQLTRPFLLRRLKSAVLDELPSRTEQNIVIEPTDDEKAFYELLRREAMERLERAEPSQKRFLILLWLTKLRRACCHPSLASEELSHAGEAIKGMGSKIERLLEVLEELVAGGHKVLVFSQFTSFLALVQEALAQAGTPFLYLDGQTPEKARRERVDAFQNGACDVFLLSLKAGGTGINLTAADYVVHLDPWWNPAVEDQASDRAHRLGQKRPVTIYRFVTAGSVEEKIIAMHQEKRELAADFLEGTGTSVTSLSDEELLALLQ
ncbi:MAG: DEAD/DEAH box helicase, partial [Desulfovibrio sp.]|nr:DEAD/DEAH box helicase [Desulfovibrio sp.]